MRSNRTMLVGIAATLLALSVPGSASMAAEEEAVYGWQLMTSQELAEHRAKMRSFNTEREREAYRQQHHERMQAGAKERDMALPDQSSPQGKGMGMGHGGGQGQGMGPGYGQGQGMGQQRGKGAGGRGS